MAQFEKINEEKRALYADAFDAVEDLVVQLLDSDVAVGTLGDAEALIKKGGMEFMRKLTEGYLNQRSAGEEKLKKLESADGESRTHRRPNCSCQIETIFGGVEFNRIGGLDHRFGQRLGYEKLPD